MNFMSFGTAYYSFTKESIYRNFASHVDRNLEPAWTSLLRENKIKIIDSNAKTFYLINFDKIKEIEYEIYLEKQRPTELEIVQPFNANFSKDLQYVFSSETNRIISNKGKYHHHIRKDDPSYWISIVTTDSGKISKPLNMGSLNNPDSRLSKILNAISTIIEETGNNTFIKKNVEDLEPKACGNNRQYSRAALDIFKYTGVIQEIYSKGISPIYTLGDKKPLIRIKNHRLDEYLDLVISPLKETENVVAKR